MTTAGIGSTAGKEAKEKVSHAAMTRAHLSELTPTSDRHDGQETSGDLVEDEDKLVEHEDSLS